MKQKSVSSELVYSSGENAEMKLERRQEEKGFNFHDKETRNGGKFHPRDHFKLLQRVLIYNLLQLLSVRTRENEDGNNLCDHIANVNTQTRACSPVLVLNRSKQFKEFSRE